MREHATPFKYLSDALYLRNQLVRVLEEAETEPDPDSTPKWPRQRVKVTMTLTTPQCPASGLIFEQVHNRLAGIPDISKVEVALVWEPKWTPHRISEAGRRHLGI